MTDPTTSILGGDYVTVSVTITATAQSISALVAAQLTSLGYRRPRLLQVSVLSNQPGVATDRAAILYGGADAQLGHLAAGVERSFPLVGGNAYVKRVGVSDVPAAIECFLRIVP